MNRILAVLVVLASFTACGAPPTSPSKTYAALFTLGSVTPDTATVPVRTTISVRGTFTFFGRNPGESIYVWVCMNAGCSGARLEMDANGKKSYDILSEFTLSTPGDYTLTAK